MIAAAKTPRVFKPHSAHALLMGAAVIAMMSASTAAAQDTDIVFEDEEDVVVSTGIRKSIEDALEIKRDSSSIVEAITAEDIGKLPDVSIADSLARLPGVTAQRVRGRAQGISIRGLGPQFSLSLLNGREIVSTNGNRGVEFDQFPSELIGSGVVYKTSDARLAATGIAGAVDLRTRKPLDTEEGFVASAKYVINDNGDLNPDFGADGYRLFGSGTFRNDADTFGATIGITHQSNPTQIFQRDLKTQGTRLVPGTRTAYPADNPRSGVESRDFKRTSVAGTLQFEPVSNVAITLDGFYSDFDDTGIFRGVETPINPDWTGASLADSVGTGDFVDAVAYSNNGVFLRTDTQGNTAETIALGGNLQFGLNDKTRLTLDAGYSEVESDGIDYESYAARGANILGSNSGDSSLRDNLAFATPEDGRYQIVSQFDYTNGSQLFLTDPGGWGQVGFLRNNVIEDELLQLRGEVERDLDLPFIGGIAAGVLFSSREKLTSDQPNALRQGAGFANDVAALPTPIGSSDSGSIGLDIVAYDPSGLIGSTYVVDSFTPSNILINEDITTLYGLVEIGSEDTKLTGNVGLQYVMTDQESTGQFGNFGTRQGSEGTAGDKYSDWLPTLNMSYALRDDVVVRFGAGKALSRAEISALSANLNISSNALVCPDATADGIPDSLTPNAVTPTSSCLNISGGNPFLRPYSTTYFDLSGEYYFSPAGAITIAAFTKNIDDYVLDATEIVRDAGLAATFLGDQFLSTFPDAAQVSVNAKGNAGQGDLKGFEIAVRLPFEDFIDNDFLSGFGFNAAFTYTDATVEFQGNDVNIPGYSSETGSAEIYYERDGFRARLNGRHRSGFEADIVQFDGRSIGAAALSETVLDAQIGYDFDERFGRFADGTSITFEVANITDEPFRTTNITAAGTPFVRRRADFGTTYNFTVSKKF